MTVDRGRSAIERLVGNVVHEVLRHPESAESVGFSRAHWSRLFAHYVGEPPATFVRRIRIEKSCELLRTTTTPTQDIAENCRCRDPSAFSRVFHREIGRTPIQYRAQPCPVPNQVHGIHWVPMWDELGQVEVVRMCRRFPLMLRLRPSVELIVQERFGSYSNIGDYLGELIYQMKRSGLEPHSRSFHTIYYDSIWTHPSSQGMRSHIGFRRVNQEDIPPGFGLVTLPGGTFATLEHAVDRPDRNDAWAWMDRHHFGKGISFDEYEGFPLPWEHSQTRLWVQVR